MDTIDAAQYEQTEVWIPDKENLFVKGVLVDSVGEKLKIEIGAEVHLVAKSDVLAAASEEKDGIVCESCLGEVLGHYGRAAT